MFSRFLELYPMALTHGKLASSARAPCVYSSYLRRALVNAALAAALSVVALSATAQETRTLRVAADPNNLPFSNDRGKGFENKIVQLVATELHATVEYTWWAQRRGFFRKTMKEGDCDIVAGVPRHFDQTLTTIPYYRSTYVMVVRKGRRVPPRSLDDPALKNLTIGVQMIGDDFSNTPPAHALSRRGIIENVRGFTLYGDYRQRDPPARIIDAVIDGQIDLAMVWGPLAGYEAQKNPNVLEWVALPSSDSLSGQTFTFEISMGVRRENTRLRDDLNRILAEKKPEIDAILDCYGLIRAEEPR